MRVTEAKRRMTRDERGQCCDNCLGTALERYRTETGREPTLGEIMPVDRDGTERLYNIFTPGHGTDSFVLHPECAEYIRNGGENPATKHLPHLCCGVAAVDFCQC